MGISPQKSRKKKRKWLKDLKTEANQELNIAQSQFKSNLCSFAWWKQALILVSIIAFYFVSSIALTFYQKDLILRLPFPLSIGKKIKNSSNWIHCSSFFCPKIQLWFPEKNCRIVLSENSWKFCGFGLFSCWQLWFHEKNCQKKFG